MVLQRSISRLVAALVLLAAFSTTAMAQDRRVTIVNNTGFTIMEFYGSNVGSDSWEEDILGPNVLSSGRSIQINFDDGSGYCQFDFKAVFDDGDVLTAKRINVCEIGRYTYN